MSRFELYGNLLDAVVFTQDETIFSLVRTRDLSLFLRPPSSYIVFITHKLLSSRYTINTTHKQYFNLLRYAFAQRTCLCILHIVYTFMTSAHSSFELLHSQSVYVKIVFANVCSCLKKNIYSNIIQQSSTKLCIRRFN